MSVQRVLEELKRRGRATASELAVALGLSRNWVCACLKDLEARGLVRAVEVASGRRGRPRRLYCVEEPPSFLEENCRSCALFHPVDGCRLGRGAAAGSTACELYVPRRRVFHAWRLRRAVKGYLCLVCGKPAVPRPPSLNPSFCLNCLTSYRLAYWRHGDPRIRVRPGVEDLVKERGGVAVEASLDDLPKARLFVGDLDRVVVEGVALIVETRLPVGGVRRLVYRLDEVERRVLYYRSRQVEEAQRDLDELAELGFQLVKSPPPEPAGLYEALVSRGERSEEARRLLWLGNAVSHYVACCRLARLYGVGVEPPLHYLRRALREADYGFRYESAIMRAYWAAYKEALRRLGFEASSRVKARLPREEALTPRRAIAPAYDPVSSMINYVHSRILRAAEALEPGLAGPIGLIHRFSKAGKWCRKHAMYLDATEPLKAVGRELLLDALKRGDVDLGGVEEVKGSLGGRLYALTSRAAQALELRVVKPSLEMELIYAGRLTTARVALEEALRGLRRLEGFKPLVFATREDLDDVEYALRGYGEALSSLLGEA